MVWNCSSFLLICPEEGDGCWLRWRRSLASLFQDLAFDGVSLWAEENMKIEVDSWAVIVKLGSWWEWFCMPSTSTKVLGPLVLECCSKGASCP
ncbi:hypothetical protein SLE2022_316880 [Rubroshorea leprosula]